MKQLDHNIEERLNGKIPGMEGLRNKLRNMWQKPEQRVQRRDLQVVQDKLKDLAGKGVFDIEGIEKWKYKAKDIPLDVLEREPNGSNPVGAHADHQKSIVQSYFLKKKGKLGARKQESIPGTGTKGIVWKQKKEPRKIEQRESEIRDQKAIFQNRETQSRRIKNVDTSEKSGADQGFMDLNWEQMRKSDKNNQIEAQSEEKGEITDNLSRGEDIFRVPSVSFQNKSNKSDKLAVSRKESQTSQIGSQLTNFGDLELTESKEDKGQSPTERERQSPNVKDPIEDSLEFELKNLNLDVSQTPVETEKPKQESRLASEKQKKQFTVKSRVSSRRKETENSELAFGSIDFSDSNFQESEYAANSASKKRSEKNESAFGNRNRKEENTREKTQEESGESEFGSILTDFVNDPMDFQS